MAWHARCVEMETIMKTLKKATASLIRIDGSQGEGGGQILRSALALSALTGQPFTLERIRAARKRPGLMRQHLTCVRALAEVCQAEVSEGLGVGSDTLTFCPGEVRSLDGQTFAIGTAGSTMLLLQALLPVLLRAPEPSRFTLVGGTHVNFAPCFEFIDEVFLAQLRRLGARVELTLVKAGFFPAGGGIVEVRVEPSSLKPATWTTKETAWELSAEVLSTPEVPKAVAEKELERVQKQLRIGPEQTWLRQTFPSHSPGNALILRALTASDDAPGTVAAAYGERGKRAEQVAGEALWMMKRFLNSPAPVDEFLADQLLLPLAMAGGGEFVASALTPHFHTNVDVIRAFLPECATEIERLDRFAWKVRLTGA